MSPHCATVATSPISVGWLSSVFFCWLSLRYLPARPKSSKHSAVYTTGIKLIYFVIPVWEAKINSLVLRESGVTSLQGCVAEICGILVRLAPKKRIDGCLVREYHKTFY